MNSNETPFILIRAGATPVLVEGRSQPVGEVYYELPQQTWWCIHYHTDHEYWNPSKEDATQWVIDEHWEFIRNRGYELGGLIDQMVRFPEIFPILSNRQRIKLLNIVACKYTIESFKRAKKFARKISLSK